MHFVHFNRIHSSLLDPITDLLGKQKAGRSTPKKQLCGYEGYYSVNYGVEVYVKILLNAKQV